MCTRWFQVRCQHVYMLAKDKNFLVHATCHGDIPTLPLWYIGGGGGSGEYYHRVGIFGTKLHSLLGCKLLEGKRNNVTFSQNMEEFDQWQNTQNIYARQH